MRFTVIPVLALLAAPFVAADSLGIAVIDPIRDGVVGPFTTLSVLGFDPHLCHEAVSDFTSATVSVQENDVVVSVSVVGLEAALECGGVDLTSLPGRTTAFYTFGLRSVPSFDDERPGFFLNARLSEDSPLGPSHQWMFKCADLAVWTGPFGSVHRSGCFPVTETSDTLTFRAPRTGTFRSGGLDYSYVFDGEYQIEGRVWSARDAGTDGMDASPTQNAATMMLIDTIDSPVFRLS